MTTMDLRYYKKGQGNRTRFAVLLLAGLILAGGVYELHQSLAFHLPQTWRDRHLNLLLAVAIWGLAFFGCYAWANRPTTADFLVEVDSELNKVTWASRREVIDASSVVFVTLLFLTTVMALADLLFGWVAKVLIH